MHSFLDEAGMPKREAHVAVDIREPIPLGPSNAEPPYWVTALTTTQPDRWFHAVEIIPEADGLSAPALDAAVTQAYGRLIEKLGRVDRHPVRFWNFIPGIHADLGDELDRYMAFNAGRFAAFRAWFGSEAAFHRQLPTASAVGVAAGPIVIHVLACADPGLPVENPRQVPAYTYSRRYGPLPPCFARATRLASARDRADHLLVGGTASIVGEDSRHERDVHEQALETFENLERLLERAFEAAGIAPRPADALEAFTNLRVYVVREDDAPAVRGLVATRFPHVESIEYAQADLCRRELLVEIEGLAQLRRGPAPVGP
jgi:chorismate lyase/3-hydroxybenzoate synthase